MLEIPHWMRGERLFSVEFYDHSLVIFLQRVGLMQIYMGFRTPMDFVCGAKQKGFLYPWGRIYKTAVLEETYCWTKLKYKQARAQCTVD